MKRSKLSEILASLGLTVLCIVAFYGFAWAIHTLIATIGRITFWTVLGYAVVFCLVWAAIYAIRTSPRD